MLKTIFRIITNIFLATIWAYFATVDLYYFWQFHELKFFLFIVAQSIFAICLVIRRPSVQTSKRLFDYVVAIAGTFTVIFLRPNSFALVSHMAGNILICLGITIEILGLLSLNTSAGIVASNRGIKTGGLYAYVRHPVYLGNILFFVGFFSLNASFTNGILLFACTMFQVVRIMSEEKVLAADPAYKSYMAKVRWKLLPGLF
jgi:protein-S-isoprenylcysteine O-methyltransferase Ste14